MDGPQVYYVSAFTQNEQATLKKLFGRDLFGTGYSSKTDLKEEQVQRILSLIKPSMRAWFKTSEVLPIFKERKALMQSELEHLETSALAREEQSVRVIDYLMNKGSYGIAILYCCLDDTSSKVPTHYQLLGELKKIVQTECGLSSDEDAFSPLLTNGLEDSAKQDVRSTMEALTMVPVSSVTAHSLIDNLRLTPYDHLINSNSLGKICLFWLSSRTNHSLEDLTQALVLTKSLGRHVTLFSWDSPETVPEVKAFLLSLEADWLSVGSYLGYSEEELSKYTSKHPENLENQVTDFLLAWRLPDIGGATLPLLHKLRQLSGIPEDINRKPLERSDKASHEHRCRHLKTDFIGKPLRSLDSFPRQSSSPTSSLSSGYSSQYSRLSSSGSMDGSTSLSQEHSRPNTSDQIHPLETDTRSASRQFSERPGNGANTTHMLENGSGSIGHTRDQPVVNGWVADDDPPIEELSGLANDGSKVTDSRNKPSNGAPDSHTHSSSELTNGRSLLSTSTGTSGTASTSQITAEDYLVSELLEGDDYYDDHTAYPKQGRRVVVLLNVGANVSKCQHQASVHRSADIRHQDPVIEEISDDEIQPASLSNAPLAIEHTPSHTEEEDSRLQGFGVDLSHSGEPQLHPHHDHQSKHQSAKERSSPTAEVPQPLPKGLSTPHPLDASHQQHLQTHTLQSEAAPDVPTPTSSSDSTVPESTLPSPHTVSESDSEPLHEASPPSNVPEPDTVNDDPVDSVPTEEPTSVNDKTLEAGDGGEELSVPEETFETCSHDLVLAIEDLDGLEVLAALLASGAKASLPTEAGDYPIHIAAARRGHEKLMLLLNHDVDINVRRMDGRTALHLACINGDFQSIQILLEKGAKPGIQDNQGYTCLHHREVLESSDIVSYLLHNRTPTDTPSHGTFFTPLLVCSFIGDSTAESALLLLGNGANVNGSTQAGSKPLVTACTMGAEQIVEVLLDNGADVNITDQHGNTPLLVAIQNKNANLAKKLLSQRSADGASAAVDINSPNKAGLTPLMAAVSTGDTELVKDLLKRGAIVNATRVVEKMSLGVYGERDVELTALSEATIVGSVEIVQLLIDNRADINSTSEKMIPPICFAIRGNFVSIVELLLKQNDMDRTVKGILWPFIVSVDTKNSHCAQLLLDRYHGGLDGMLEDATHHGLQNLVTHIHTYQQLVDPQSHGATAPTTQAPISPQEMIRPQSPPKGDSLSSATVLSDQSGLDTDSSDDEGVVIMGSVDTASNSDSTSADFGFPLNEFNKPVGATSSCLIAANSDADSSGKNLDAPSSPEPVTQETSHPQAPVLAPVTQQDDAHGLPDSTQIISPLSQSSPLLPQTEGTVSASSHLPLLASNDTHPTQKESSASCHLNDLGAQSPPSPPIGTSNVILNRLTSDSGASPNEAGPTVDVQSSALTELQAGESGNEHQASTPEQQESQRLPSPTPSPMVPDVVSGAEVLNEFAQICISVVCDLIGQEKLIEVATSSGMDHIGTFFLKYFYESSGFCRSGDLLHGFYGGMPSPLTFLIRHTLLTKVKFYSTLEEMGRQDFPKLLRSALLQFQGGDLVPLSATALIDNIFDLSHIIGSRGNPMSRGFDNPMALSELMRERAGLTPSLPTLPPLVDDPPCEPPVERGHRLGKSGSSEAVPETAGPSTVQETPSTEQILSLPPTAESAPFTSTSPLPTERTADQQHSLQTSSTHHFSASARESLPAPEKKDSRQPLQWTPKPVSSTGKRSPPPGPRIRTLQDGVTSPKLQSSGGVSRIRTLHDGKTSPKPGPLSSSQTVPSPSTSHDERASSKPYLSADQLSPSHENKISCNGIGSPKLEQVQPSAQKLNSQSEQGSSPERPIPLTHLSRLLKEDEERQQAQAKSILPHAAVLAEFHCEQSSVSPMPDHPLDRDASPSSKHGDSPCQLETRPTFTTPQEIPVHKTASPIVAISRKEVVSAESEYDMTTNRKSVKSPFSQPTDTERTLQADWPRSTPGMDVFETNELLQTCTSPSLPRQPIKPLSNKQGVRNNSKQELDAQKRTFESTVQPKKGSLIHLSQVHTATKRPPSIINTVSSAAGEDHSRGIQVVEKKKDPSAVNFSTNTKPDSMRKPLPSHNISGSFSDASTKQSKEDVVCCLSDSEKQSVDSDSLHSDALPIKVAVSPRPVASSLTKEDDSCVKTKPVTRIQKGRAINPSKRLPGSGIPKPLVSSQSDKKGSRVTSKPLGVSSSSSISLTKRKGISTTSKQNSRKVLSDKNLASKQVSAHKQVTPHKPSKSEGISSTSKQNSQKVPPAKKSSGAASGITTSSATSVSNSKKSPPVPKQTKLIGKSKSKTVTKPTTTSTKPLSSSFSRRTLGACGSKKTPAKGTLGCETRSAKTPTSRVLKAKKQSTPSNGLHKQLSSMMFTDSEVDHKQSSSATESLCLGEAMLTSGDSNGSQSSHVQAPDMSHNSECSASSVSDSQDREEQAASPHTLHPDRPIPDDEAKLLFQALANEVQKWKFLGRYLDIRDEKLEELAKCSSVEIEQCYQMLLHWAQSSTEGVTYLHLGQALKDVMQEKLLDRVWFEMDFKLPINSERLNTFQQELSTRRNNVEGTVHVKCTLHDSSNGTEDHTLNFQLSSTDVDVSVVELLCLGAQSKKFNTVSIVIVIVTSQY